MSPAVWIALGFSAAYIGLALVDVFVGHDRERKKRVRAFNEGFEHGARIGYGTALVKNALADESDACIVSVRHHEAVCDDEAVVVDLGAFFGRRS